MTDTPGTNHGGRISVWVQRATVWTLGVATATIPLYFTLQNDRELQRSELGIADQHSAYTDVLNAADELILPRYVRWDLMNSAEGKDGLNLTQRGEIENSIAEAFPEDRENTITFEEAATRLRLVIPAEDAWLISALTDSLNPWPEGATVAPMDRVSAYTQAKLNLVNEFREDVLSEEALPADEGEKLNAQALEAISFQAALRGLEAALAELQEGPP